MNSMGKIRDVYSLKKTENFVRSERESTEKGIKKWTNPTITGQVSIPLRKIEYFEPSELEQKETSGRCKYRKETQIYKKSFIIVDKKINLS